jgi:hypothetical protein
MTSAYCCHTDGTTRSLNALRSSGVSSRICVVPACWMVALASSFSFAATSRLWVLASSADSWTIVCRSAGRLSRNWLLITRTYPM